MDSFQQILNLDPHTDVIEERITLAELQRAIRTADPRARLILPRILRRVIKQDCGLTGFAFRVPHRKSYVIDRQSLLNIVEPDEIGLGGLVLPDKLILIAQPDQRKLLETSPDQALVRCWRLLFHARVHLAVQERIAEKSLNPSALRERIHQIGEVEFDEIRSVLGQEGFLLPPRNDRGIYEEFAAVFWELRYFAWNALPRYFPALEDLDEVAAVLSQDVDAQWLYLITRPLNAPDPVDRSASDDLGAWIGSSEEAPSPPPHKKEPPSASKYRRLMRKARRPESLGNVVGGAICHVKALRCAPPERVDRSIAAIKEDVNRLIGRLEAALQLSHEGPQPWHDSLQRLVLLSAGGYWTPEARLLYDLQKVCVDYERDISKIDLVRWLFSFGRRPIKRPLPNQRDVLASQHLHGAQRRLASVRLPESQRKHLAALIRSAMQQVEARLREKLRPKIRDALDTVGLSPRNLPEQVAQKKIVEELLDRVVERGFLSMGDLRDALSRNALKLPDIGGPGALMFGDPLLQADKRLAELLDGVYRPSEFYLRWLQQLSSLGFGTRIGRFLTLSLVVPFGGSFLIYKGLNHLVGFFLKHSKDINHYENSSAIVLLGVFIFGLVNVRWFRKFVGQSFLDAYYSTNKNFVTPLWNVVQLRIVQVILSSMIFRLSLRFLIKPAAWTFLAWMVFPLVGVNWRVSLTSAAYIFVAFNVFLNSRVGRNIEEMAMDWAVQTWNRYGIRFFMGLFWLVIDFFNVVLEAVERLLYGVDEWLRFRSGETTMTLCLKAGLGAVWAFVAYILRFCINLLIEPQLNPIKHFPVVTVSHKLLLPLTGRLASIFESSMGMDKGWALTLAPIVIISIPGIFGFLVWELKENWRLYAANRKKGLSPVVIGKHGENMLRLLKPGFHSGTLPKLFAKLRRAERKARAGGNWRPVRKYLHALERFELSIRRYIEREFLALLAGSNCPCAAAIKAREIRLATNRVQIFFARDNFANHDLSLALEINCDWLAGGVARAGWADRLPDYQREAIISAVLGLYKTAGLELVEQQIKAAFSPLDVAYDINPRGIVVYPETTLCHPERSEGSPQTEVVYDLKENIIVAPQVPAGNLQPVMPEVDRSKLMFSEFQITWRQWVDWWESYKRSPDHCHEPLAPFPVLPLTE
ncbi:MAG: hypothetical protein ABSG67_02730 [Thermoguttaceae bacterium]